MGTPNAIVPSINNPVNDDLMAGDFSPFDDESHAINFDFLLDESLVEGVMNESSGGVAGDSEARPWGVPVEENVHENVEWVPHSTLGNPIQIPVWPVLPLPYSCTCCQTLRELFHVKGTLVNKLEIHGRVGMINHAVLDRYNSESSSQNHEYHMFDFCNESMNNVKQFLVQYCDDCRKDGYVMLQDPLANFYDALCTGLYDNGNIFPKETQTGLGNGQTNEQGRATHEDGETSRARRSKSHIAAQRERARNLGAKDLAVYFHLPIRAASKQINICETALKKICRKEGLNRWPHRQIKTIQRQIAKRRKSLNSNDPEEQERGRAEIQTLERTLERFNVGSSSTQHQ